MDATQKKILIVDDDQGTVKQIKRAITSHFDWFPEVAYNGEEAFGKIKNNTPYDLVILDLLIPKLNGIEICQEMAKDERLKKIPVLLISILPLRSRAFTKSLEKFSELSVVKMVLEKPFSEKDLLEKVKNIIEMSEIGS